MMSSRAREGIRCPTCGALQGWAEVCRRCKCDLRLLRAAVRAYERNRRQCVLLLYAGFSEAALAHARRCHELRPGAESRRLIALGHLVRESWLDALRAAAQVDEDKSEANR
jgi:hypothetical protein